jgi:hypothetical protein
MHAVDKRGPAEELRGVVEAVTVQAAVRLVAGLGAAAPQPAGGREPRVRQGGVDHSEQFEHPPERPFVLGGRQAALEPVGNGVVADPVPFFDLGGEIAERQALAWYSPSRACQKSSLSMNSSGWIGLFGGG